jgi:hypothetical protein
VGGVGKLQAGDVQLAEHRHLRGHAFLVGQGHTGIGQALCAGTDSRPSRLNEICSPASRQLSLIR